MTSLKKQLLLCVLYYLFYMWLWSLKNTALLSRMASKDRNELQIWTIPEVGLIDERTLNLSTAVPTVVVTNTVASGRGTPSVTVAILPTLQTLLPSNLSG